MKHTNVNALRALLPVLLVLLPAAPVPALPAQEPEKTEAEEESVPLWSQAKSLYEKALDSGEEVPEWLKRDLDSIGDWEYQVVELPLREIGDLQERLNLLGKERWECFEVVQVKGEIILFLKRPTRSYLQSIPISDLAKLLSRLREGSGEE